MALSYYKTKNLRIIFIIYWFLLAYIIAALIWWFIALNQQNHQMAQYKLAQLKHDAPNYIQIVDEIQLIEKKKTAQYIGEGSIFLLLLLTGAVFIYRAVRRQFKQGRQQQHFMMAVTHELKTPIAVTKLNLETLQKRKLTEEQQQHLIANTIQEANRLNALCNNMLLASQMEAGSYTSTKEEINLSELVNECANDFMMRFSQRIIIVNIENEIFIDGDKLLLQMAVNNLIDNALKYSPKASTVEVSLSKERNIAFVSIKDEGKGIDMSEKQKVFDKFYRMGKTDGKGTGLGLYLTQKIIRQHNANIFVTDNTPTGSIFTIRFNHNS
ncbi:sensor histidine kinase [Ferruginibacter albus]|uniref:sensor histidine kinase n=1 Tax=Ferruginibacter albus TaxID=2875540 RepID=UPI001CC3C638|nr:ATP-binding protein [Ferruginibacter albus]UAY51901.1 two-component sensor histidine kinase [Ferruginibacter albus]